MLALGEWETRSPQRKKTSFVKYSILLEGAEGEVGRGAYLIPLTMANTVQ